MAKLVWLNGEVQPLDKAVTSVADHAFLYGDGLFEGIRIYNGRAFLLEQHLKRLYNGAKHLGFETTVAHDDLKEIVNDMVKQSGFESGYVRINLTRGTGLGLDPSHIDRRPNLMVMVNTLALYSPEEYDNGLHTILCSTRVFPPQCLDPRLKTIGRYVANIQAKMEANRQGAGEGIMLNTEGYLAEATGDNIFLVHDKVIRTPHISCGILGGITRATAIHLAKSSGFEVREEFMTAHDIFTADEAFLTGTAAEIIPMVSLDGKKIGCGAPGPVTRKIMALYRELANDTSTV
jgi:branched-chain amino acid aminotransferase